LLSQAQIKTANKRKEYKARYWWLIPVILATGKAVIRRIAV
jgi:hypothetical protein